MTLDEHLGQQAARATHLRGLGTALQQLTWEAGKLGDGSMERLGLTVPQVMVLVVLERLGGSCSMHDVARHTHQSGATLTGIVDRLIAAGLVTRQRGERDRRVVTVALTEAGRSRLAQANALGSENLATMTAAFSDAELEQFTALVTKFLQGMERLIAQLNGGVTE